MADIPDEDAVHFVFMTDFTSHARQTLLSRRCCRAPVVGREDGSLPRLPVLPGLASSASVTVSAGRPRALVPAVVGASGRGRRVFLWPRFRCVWDTERRQG